MQHRSRYLAVDPGNPEAAAMCDRGGEVRRRRELQKEMIYAGGRLVWNGYLCCAQHLDRPFPQDALQVLPPDPVPVRDPRPSLDGANGAATNPSPLLDNYGLPLQGNDGSLIFP